MDSLLIRCKFWQNYLGSFSCCRESSWAGSRVVGLVWSGHKLTHVQFCFTARLLTLYNRSFFTRSLHSLHLTKAISFIVYYIVTFYRLRLPIDISIFWCLTAVCLFLSKNYYYYYYYKQLRLRMLFRITQKIVYVKCESRCRNVPCRYSIHVYVIYIYIITLYCCLAALNGQDLLHYNRNPVILVVLQ